jgi:SAM-dependent methyltransferase
MDTSELEEYFKAKAYVDDKSLHEPTKSLFLSLAGGLGGKVLDLGCGSGKMLQRLLKRELPQFTTYIGVDSNPIVTKPFEGTFNAFSGRVQTDVKENGIEITTPRGTRISLHIREVEEFLREESQFEIITSCSFFDLVNIYSLLPLVYEKLKRGGLVYFICNFDGETSFEPMISPELDERIVRLYHNSMRKRNLELGVPDGEYRCGRKLAPMWQRCGGKVSSLGSSDWVIYPRDGKYREEERYFLKSILNFVVQSLKGCSEIEPEDISYWSRERNSHLEKGELFFLAPITLISWGQNRGIFGRAIYKESFKARPSRAGENKPQPLGRGSDSEERENNR